jgi:ABC-type uncharacterized transport system ATPase subunit
VADLADRIHVLNFVRTLASGQVEQVLNDPKVLDAYIGRVEGHLAGAPIRCKRRANAA